MGSQASSEDEDRSAEQWSTRGLPRRLGRYELIAEIGTGGMASVFLARTTGPGRFHKWVAVKRIHPHLARDKRFVEMFLDEARLAAAIQHPNVAQVFDLGEEDEEFFLAMEYLEGEHLGSVASRLFSKRKARFPLPLAARIVAASAQGLHKAHEAQDENGDPFGLVHRDVSPHNIFVSYGGDVKVMDFGVAKAAGRITSTETGGRKGKLAYMSPEQLLNEGVDRRTDIFALGVVLWEITLGRRLFRTDNDAQTITKILQSMVPLPTTLDPSYPLELEQIVMKCLAREATDRYATAQELAIDLEQFEQRHSTANGTMGLTALMKDLFPELIERKRQMLRTAAASPASEPTPARTRPEPGAATEISAPNVPEVSTVTPARGQDAQPRSRVPLLVAVGSIAVVSLAGIGAWATSGRGSIEPSEPVVAAPPPVIPSTPIVAAVPVPRPVAEPVARAAPEVVAPPSAPAHEEPRAATSPRAPRTSSSTTSARPTPEARPSASTTTAVQILAMGAWAHVRIDGREVGQTPYNGQIPVGDHTIELLTEDGRTFSTRQTASEGERLRVTHRFE